MDSALVAMRFARGLKRIWVSAARLGQVHTALLRRNALALWIDGLWDAKGDGAELVCGAAARENLGPNAPDVALWRRRYGAALARLRSAGTATVTDEEEGFARHAELRTQWESLVHSLASTLAFSADQVDVPLAHPKRRP